jgi:hypothetical protein
VAQIDFGTKSIWVIADHRFKITCASLLPVLINGMMTETIKAINLRRSPPRYFRKRNYLGYPASGRDLFEWGLASNAVRVTRFNPLRVEG